VQPSRIPLYGQLKEVSVGRKNQTKKNAPDYHATGEVIGCEKSTKVVCMRGVSLSVILFGSKKLQSSNVRAGSIRTAVTKMFARRSMYDIMNLECAHARSNLIVGITILIHNTKSGTVPARPGSLAIYEHHPIVGFPFGLLKIVDAMELPPPV
jgi:hypothetical protein